MIVQEIKKHFIENYSGTILEVGAGFPELGNPVFTLRKIGWDIISVEPNPIFCNEFREIGLPVLEYAAYSKDIGETEFTIYSNGLSYSSLNFENKYSIHIDETVGNGFKPDTAINNNLSKNFNYEYFPESGKKKTIKVNAFTLNTILKKHPPLKNIDVVIVDVEGFELDVMRGIDLKKYVPKIIILENIRSYPEYRTFMDSNGYALHNRIDIDDIYIKK